MVVGVPETLLEVAPGTLPLTGNLPLEIELFDCEVLAEVREGFGFL